MTKPKLKIPSAIKNVSRYLFFSLLLIFYNNYLHFYLSIYLSVVIPSLKNLPKAHNSSQVFVNFEESFIYIPVSSSSKKSASSQENSKSDSDSASNFLFISDPHILGPNIHFLDKFWHELNMGVSFTAVNEILKFKFSSYQKIILGDIFDYGLFYQATDPKHVQATSQNDKTPNASLKKSFETFQKDLGIFYKIFKDSHAILGNHDVAFPKMTNKFRINRMNEIFGRKSTSEILSLNGVNFVVLNSSGFISQKNSESQYNREIGEISMRNLEEISRVFKAEQKLTSYQNSLINGTVVMQMGSDLEPKSKMPKAPILLQHFPLWRESDEVCSFSLPDSAKYSDRLSKNQPDREALSNSVSKKILSAINPRIIFSGHTHNGCLRKHVSSSFDRFEVSVASFNYRNRDNPVYVLASVSDEFIIVTKNFIPSQKWMIVRYILGITFLIFRAIKNWRKTHNNEKGAGQKKEY